MLAGCTDCAALSADLGIITRATATSVVPPRPRDFRITPEQAASARGGIVDRVRRWFASPGSVAVRPLAGAAVAMGLVVVLLAPSLRPTGWSAGGDAQPVTAPQATSVLKATAAAPDGPAAGAEMFTAAETADTMSAEADTTQLRVAHSPAPTGANGETATRDAATQAPGPLVAEAPSDVDGAGPLLTRATRPWTTRPSP